MEREREREREKVKRVSLIEINSNILQIERE